MGSTLYDIAPLLRNKRIISSCENHLDIIVCKPEWDPEFLQLINPLIHRWRSLVVQEPIVQWPSRQELDLERPAPLLEVIQARHHPGREPRILNLFAGEASLLQRLEMPDVMIRLSPRSFQNLRVLSLLVGHSCSTFTANEVLALLPSFGRLEDLSMYGPTCRILSGPGRVPPQEIVLPNLKNISFHAPCLSTFQHALSSISAPLLRYVFVKVPNMAHHELYPAVKTQLQTGIMAVAGDNITKAKMAGETDCLIVETWGTVYLKRVCAGPRWWQDGVVNPPNSGANSLYTFFPTISHTLVDLSIRNINGPRRFLLGPPLSKIPWDTFISLEKIVVSFDRIDAVSMEEMLAPFNQVTHSVNERLCQRWPCPFLKHIEFCSSIIDIEMLHSLVKRRYGLGDRCSCDPMGLPPPLERVNIQGSSFIKTMRDVREILSDIKKIIGDGVLLFSPR
ncbi:hypothetical protein FRC02_010275 [Tulasnella sp. 418]|nr:hypothetical protein FRC02_010275 [Tulasnella sp. 418]